MAETRADAAKAFDSRIAKHQAKYPKAIACLEKDRDELLAFYDFPAEHWQHLRTTNPIESMFATVRLRHRRIKGCGSRVVCLVMVFKPHRGGRKNMATSERFSAGSRRHRWSSVQGRNPR